MVPGAPSMVGLGCSKLLVCVAVKDVIRDRAVWYYEAVKENGWEGEAELFEVEDEDHAVHISNLKSEGAKKMMKHLASFLHWPNLIEACDLWL